MSILFDDDELIHATTCELSLCENPNCCEIKLLRHHVLRCGLVVEQRKCSITSGFTIPINAKCGTCLDYWDLVKMHAKTCSAEDCTLENCKTLRPSQMRRRLMARSTVSTSGSLDEAQTPVHAKVGPRKQQVFFSTGSYSATVEESKTEEEEEHSNDTLKKETSSSSFCSFGSEQLVPVIQVHVSYGSPNCSE